jgi:hypothetical protein
MWIGSLLITAWVTLGSFVAVFPGVLEKIFGVGYNFKDNWGVGRGRFELYTLVTLAVILVFGILGYVAGGDVRRQAVSVEGDRPEPTDLPDDLPPPPTA